MVFHCFIHFIFLGNQVLYLHRAGRWRWVILSLHHPSPVGAAGWQRRTPGLWEVRTRHCASGCGSESNRRRRSWCPGQGCSGCRSLESKRRRSKTEREQHEAKYSQTFTHNFPQCVFSHMWWFCLCWETVWCSLFWCELVSSPVCRGRRLWAGWSDQQWSALWSRAAAWRTPLS